MRTLICIFVWKLKRTQARISSISANYVCVGVSLLCHILLFAITVAAQGEGS